MALVWICSLFLIVSHLWRWWNAARRGRFWTFWHLHGCGQMTQEAPLHMAIRSVCWVCPSQYHNLEHDPTKDPYRVFLHPPLSLPSMTNSAVSYVHIHLRAYMCVTMCLTQYSPNNVLIDGLFGFPFFLNSAAPPQIVNVRVVLTLNSTLKHNHPDRRSHIEPAVKGLTCSCPLPIPTTIYQNLTGAEPRHSPTPGTWTSWTISKFL
jgi:hypothetical protein